MDRIFKSLATFTTVFLVATFALGLSVMLGDIRDATDAALQSRLNLHRLSGVLAGVLVLLVDSIVVTYFIGTSRWCKEVCETYGIDNARIAESQRLKRVSFPWALLNMLTALAIVVLGGAADPAATTKFAQPGSLTWAQLHFIGAGLGIGLIGWGFVKQWHHVVANFAVIDSVMREVQRIRAAKGLPEN